MRVATFPVNEARKRDPKFKLLMDGRQDKFWEYHEKSSKINLSKEFKDLVSSMMEPMSELRIDLPDIITSPWMQLPTATKEEVNAEM